MKRASNKTNSFGIRGVLCLYVALTTAWVYAVPVHLVEKKPEAKSGIVADSNAIKSLNNSLDKYINTINSKSPNAQNIESKPSDTKILGPKKNDAVERQDPMEDLAPLNSKTNDGEMTEAVTLEKEKSNPTTQKADLVAAWIEDKSTSKDGHFEFIDISECRPISYKTPPFYISGYFSSFDESAFEILRSTGTFKKDNSNALSLVPVNSVLVADGFSETTEEYRQVQVAAIANWEEKINGPLTLTQVKDVGFIHKESIRNARDYVFIVDSLPEFRPQAFNPIVNSLGERALRLTMNSSAHAKGIRCCTNRKCESFALFDVLAEEYKDTSFQVAISPQMSGIFQSTTPQFAPTSVGQDNSPFQQEEQKPPATQPTEEVTTVSPEIIIPKMKPTEGDQPAKKAQTPPQEATVICVTEGKANVREKNGSSFDKILTQVDSGTLVRINDLPTESFTDPTSKKNIQMQQVTLVLPDLNKEKNVGWVNTELLKARKDCSTATSGQRNSSTATPEEKKKTSGPALKYDCRTKALTSNRQCLACNAYYETLDGPYKTGSRTHDPKIVYRDMVEVDRVVLARVKNENFPNTICGVVKQKYQFSWLGLRKDFNKVKWEMATRATDEALDAGASRFTYYHANYVYPDWRRASNCRMEQKITHLFYWCEGGLALGKAKKAHKGKKYKGKRKVKVVKRSSKKIKPKRYNDR